MKPVKLASVDSNYISDPANYGTKLQDDYLEYCLKISKRNAPYIHYTMHAIVGQLFRKKYFMLDELKVDMCTPLIILQDTGSGKTVLKHFLIDFGQALGLNTKDVSLITAGGLMGTSVYDPVEKKQKIVYGYLYDTNLLIVDEADAIFHNLDSEHYKDCAMALQKTADSYVNKDTRIHKKLTLGDAVDFFANCTSILGSYIPKTFNDLATNTGMFPRHVTLVRHIQLEERIAVINELIDSLNVARPEKYKDEYNKLVSRFQALKRVYGTTEERIEFTNAARDRVRQASAELVDVVRDSSLLTRHVLGGFLVRYVIMLMKLSCHHAILRYSKQVEVEDVSRARDRFILVWQTLTAYMEMSLITDEKEKMIFNSRIHSAVEVWHILSKDKTAGLVIKINGGTYVRLNNLVDKLRFLSAWGDSSLNASKEYFLTHFVKKSKQVDPKAFFEIEEQGKSKVQYVKLIRDLIL